MGTHQSLVKGYPAEDRNFQELPWKQGRFLQPKGSPQTKRCRCWHLGAGMFKHGKRPEGLQVEHRQHLPCWLQMVPDLRWFYFMAVQKQYTFSRNCTLDFEFWSFSGLDMLYDPLVIQGRAVSRSSQSAMRSQQQTTNTFTTFCTHTTLLVFTFSTVSNKLHERVNTVIK